MSRIITVHPPMKHKQRWRLRDGHGRERIVRVEGTADELVHQHEVYTARGYGIVVIKTVNKKLKGGI